MQVAPIIEALLFGLRQKAAKHEYPNPKSCVREVRDVSNFRVLSLGLVSDFVLRDSGFPRRWGVAITLNFSITIPDRLTWPFVVLALWYRRVRYGYAFRRIPLTQGKYAIVDPEDFERLNRYKWHVVWGSMTYYASRNSRIGNKRIAVKMHREIINPPEPLVVDHINHKGYDNRRANLRPATRSQNAVNTSIVATSSGSSKYRGVAWHRNIKKWQAHIGIKYKQINIGYFKDELEAAKAYDKAAKEYHGEFAVLNVPDSP